MDFKTTVSLLPLLLLGFCNAHDGNVHGTESEILVETPANEDITTTILRMNNASTDFLLEGDVIIPTTRNAMKCASNTNSCLWPKSANGYVEIPFELSDSYDDTEKKAIAGAMRELQAKTCIRFITHTTQMAYLSLEPRSGCASLLGRTGLKQVVSLQRYGCVQHGIIQHELLHAMGFYHEHTRSDRDSFVKISWGNIDPVFTNNFQKQDTNNLNTPYDYSSVMHYGRTAFGKNGLETITPIPDASVPIGQRNGVSKIDISRINKLYSC
ncbi:low choriolytic enzyme-like [Mastacembelus armatus]|uniref:low choriolytic enzyme-like n=1 Tax=Mastacembelus armatus TaxID=205130 RepID=UPI000E463A01|nr:low choriolytic enzyme-like [Mastacembelus armatus]